MSGAIVFVLWLAGATMLIAQAPPQQTKPRATIGAVGVSKPAKTESRLKMTARPGELIVSGEEGPERRPFTQSFRLPNNVHADVIAKVEPTGGRLRYQYVVVNRPGSPGSIHHFSVRADRPDLFSNATAAPGWRVSGVSLREWGGVPRFNWWPQLDKPDLAPGTAGDGFSFESDWLPGLTTAYIQTNTAREAPRFYMSPDDEELFYRAISFENISARVVTIGPKMPPNENVTEAMALEFREAAMLPEFKGLEGRVMELAVYAETGLRAQLESALAKATGATPLQQTFFEAMRLALKYAR